MSLTLPILKDGHLLTHSSEATFRTCPRKYLLSYRMALRPAHQHAALRLGSAFHLGLEVLKHGGTVGVAPGEGRVGLVATVRLPAWKERN